MKKYAQGGIYTAEMGQPPMDPEGGSVKPMPRPAMKRPAKKMPPMKRPMPKGGGMESAEQPTPVPGMKKGGSVSSRADGCAQRGKTNCKMY
jgi:hypothetical protein